MEKIKKTIRLSSRMLLPQTVAYYATQKEGLAPLVTQVPLLNKSRTPFTVSLEALEAAYKHAAARLLEPEMTNRAGLPRLEYEAETAASGMRAQTSIDYIDDRENHLAN